MTKDDRVRFTLRIPEKTYDAIKTQAKNGGMSVNALILNILREWVKKDKEHNG